MKRTRRFVWYLASRLALVVFLFSMCIFVLYYAMNATNIYAVLKDGMAQRAKIIMMDEDDTNLTKFFLESYILRDQNIQNALIDQSPYEYYTIRGIDHRLSLTWYWAWPWDNIAHVSFTEKIPLIDGRLNMSYASPAQELYGENYQAPPPWPNANYDATMVKVNNRWYIKSLSISKIDIEQK